MIKKVKNIFFVIAGSAVGGLVAAGMINLPLKYIQLVIFGARIDVTSVSLLYFLYFFISVFWGARLSYALGTNSEPAALTYAKRRFVFFEFIAFSILASVSLILLKMAYIHETIYVL